MKLNLGCFHSKIPGFMGVDVQEVPEADIICDIRNLSFAENDSVEEIYSSHCLEHFPYWETIGVLKEWYRVLKPGGILWLAVPDIMKIISLIKTYGYLPWLECVIYGNGEYKDSAHKAGFDYEKIYGMLKGIGFSEVGRVKYFPYGLSDASTITVTLDGKSTGETISLNVKAIK